MKVGMTVFFQNPEYLREIGECAVGVSDRDVYIQNLEMAEQAEDLGYDALWSVEHHFTGYTMVPDVLQFLGYMAGKTKRITLGSAAVILPWHNPVRVAESVSMLDNLSGGRLILGMGRGLGRVEFEGFNIPMSESRERFIEAAELVLNGLKNGFVEFNGKYYQQPKRWLRPAPTRSFVGRSYAAAVSPESQEIMAKLGVGILISPQKPWPTTIKEHDSYKRMFENINSRAAPTPIITCQVFCDEDEVRAKELGVKYLGDYFRTANKHYELTDSHLKDMKGYEYYGKITQRIEGHGDEVQAAQYAELQVYGTPKQCVDRIAEMRDNLGCQDFNAIFSFGGLSREEAMRNMKSFSEKVKPRLQAM
ncbi:MAG: LLM class flavin-dependent oxidoreductase [Rhizomicrobium sp.]